MTFIFGELKNLRDVCPFKFGPFGGCCAGLDFVVSQLLSRAATFQDVLHIS